MSDDVITFKSAPCFYFKEESGVKPNTLREDDQTDARFISLCDEKSQPKRIRIVNAKDKNLSFEREITDISFYQGWWVISWKHKESPEMDID